MFGAATSWTTEPYTTLSTEDASTAERARSSATTAVERSSVDSLRSAVPDLANGVRSPSTIATLRVGDDEAMNVSNS